MFRRWAWHVLMFIFDATAFVKIWIERLGYEIGLCALWLSGLILVLEWCQMQRRIQVSKEDKLA